MYLLSNINQSQEIQPQTHLQSPQSNPQSICTVFKLMRTIRKQEVCRICSRFNDITELFHEEHTLLSSGHLVVSWKYFTHHTLIDSHQSSVISHHGYYQILSQVTLGINVRTQQFGNA